MASMESRRSGSVEARTRLERRRRNPTRNSAPSTSKPSSRRSKISARASNSAPSSRRTTARRGKSNAGRKGSYRFPQARGKTLDMVEFYTCPGCHIISVRFQDKTSLDFIVEPSFAVEPIYSDWKTGNERQVRKWRTIRSASEGCCL
jgi:DNA-directed RNA polymerase subunit M/transcription elongation factor TFIIS